MLIGAVFGNKVLLDLVPIIQAGEFRPKQVGKFIKVEFDDVADVMEEEGLSDQVPIKVGAGPAVEDSQADGGDAIHVLLEVRQDAVVGVGLGSGHRRIISDKIELLLGCRSGQSIVTVNHAPQGYAGSNPAPSTRFLGRGIGPDVARQINLG